MSEKRLNILIVDDSKAMAQTVWRNIRMALTGRICLKFEMVTSAEKAIQLLTHSVFDVVISDIQMKGMNGFDFLSHLISNDQFFTQNTFFILMSGNNPREYFEAAENLGAKFCPKDELNKIIEMIKIYFSIY